ncbi:CopD family protein [Vineibacter terrae]|uniref:CopD family protein n=1 Tax=Vineibacter terrae TaxID=2586908 RepID=UPI002E2F57A8|nr:CopD family protein [Vineibacter terrae]HEX2885784.1 CopD family protein [Vineibacter terrae]
MTYLWIKAVHLVAVMAWIGGMLVLALLPLQEPRDRRLLDIVGRWDRRVTAPAMLLAWCLGLTMALQAHWLSSPWLWIKLVIAAAVSATHGVLSGRLRRAADAARPKPPVLLRFAAPFILIAVTSIVVLVVTKPA